MYTLVQHYNPFRPGTISYYRVVAPGEIIHPAEEPIAEYASAAEASAEMWTLGF